MKNLQLTRFNQWLGVARLSVTIGLPMLFLVVLLYGLCSVTPAHADSASVAGMTVNSTGFTVTSIYPLNAAFNIASNTVVSAAFNRVVDFTTVSTRTFTVRGSQTGIYTGTYMTGSVQLDPAQGLKPGEEIMVNLSNGLETTDGIALTPYAWQFWAGVTDGSGVFEDSGQTIGDSQSRGLALGDLDGDGDLDAFVGNWGDDKVWLNDGTGVFTDGEQSLFWGYTDPVALGDIDGDGDLDALSGHAEDPATIRVWLNNGTGNFTGTQVLGIPSLPNAILLGDMDGDGDLDAYLGIEGVQAPWLDELWLNDGAGHFSRGGQLGLANTSGAALGDLDSDGDLDIFVANGEGDSQPNEVWLNDGTGQFTDSGQRLGNYQSEEVALGDVDGDGDLDAFVANAGPQVNKLWLNDGAGNFSISAQHLGFADSMAVALGDADGDGDLDAFIANSSALLNEVWVNDGSGKFTGVMQPLGAFGSKDLSVGDLDSDGDLDVFVVNDGEPNQVWFNLDIVPPTIAIMKGVRPQGQVNYGDEITYTILIDTEQGTPLGFYDPLTDTTFTRFVEQPKGITHSDGVIIGTLTVTPTNQVTVSFVVRVGIPGTVGWMATVANRACVYLVGGTLDDCLWSAEVTNPAFRPYSIFLPVVMRNK